VAEWLRRWIANPLISDRESSNLFAVVLLFSWRNLRSTVVVFWMEDAKLQTDYRSPKTGSIFLDMDPSTTTARARELVELEVMSYCQLSYCQLSYCQYCTVVSLCAWHIFHSFPHHLGVDLFATNPTQIPQRRCKSHGHGGSDTP
jgi:hypothetical protein